MAEAMRSTCPFDVDMKKYEGEAAKAEEDARIFHENTVKKLRAEMEQKMQKRKKMDEEEIKKLKEKLE